MKRIITIFLLLAVVSAVQAQITVSGHVRDGDGKPVEAFVTLSAKGSEAMEGFTDADEKGYYRIEYAGQADSLVLTASGMGFGNMVRVVANRTQTVNFTINEQAFSIKEVIVKADKIREAGDTLNYNVAAYRDQTDRVIGDVLKKMPGIEVSDGGRIKFNGKDVKNFYVENMDLLQGRYGIATNNISAEDVTMVQVMQNHQPIRAMKDLKPSDDVAINLKLRKEAKGTLAVTAMLGAGASEAWQGDRLLLAGELVSMYFGKRQQNMTLYKGNNMGIDVAGEFRQHGGGAGLIYGRAPLSMLTASQPGIAKKRFLQNRSHVASTNHIVKIDSTRDMTLNAVYHEDRLKRSGESVSDYYLASGSRMRIGETTSSADYIHHLEASAKYQVNQHRLYLTDRLNIDVNWNKSHAVGTIAAAESPVQLVSQHLKSPQLTIDNDFYLLRNLGTTSYYIRTKAGYNQKPHRLECDTLSQDYTVRSVAANIRTGYGWKWGNFKLDYLLMSDMNLQKVESNLSGFRPSVDQYKNDYRYNRYNVGVEQYMHLDLYKWLFTLTIPFLWENQHLNDRQLGFNDTWNNVFVSPSAEIKCIMGQSWFTLSGSYYRIVDNAQRAGRGLVMHNYRTFQRNIIEDASRQRTLSSSLSFYHKNTIRQFFFNGSVSWLHSRNSNVTGIDYDGMQTILRVVPMEHDYDNYQLKGEVSKGFDFWRSTIKIVSNYGLTNTQQLIQRQPTDVHSRYWSASAYVFTNPLPWLSIASAYAYGQSKSYVANEAEAQRVNNSTTRIDINILPTNRLMLNFAVEDNYNNLTDENRHCWFGDAKVRYKTKTVDYELEAGNLFNRKTYTRVNYSGLDIFTSTSRLRPRNIVGTVRFKLL